MLFKFFKPVTSQFIYLGKEKPSITLSEFFKIEQELASNPIQVKKGIHEDIQEQRKEQNQKPLSKPTFYESNSIEIMQEKFINWLLVRKPGIN